MITLAEAYQGLSLIFPPPAGYGRTVRAVVEAIVAVADGKVATVACGTVQEASRVAGVVRDYMAELGLGELGEWRGRRLVDAEGEAMLLITAPGDRLLGLSVDAEIRNNF